MKTKCSKKLPGIFMSDGQRNCYKTAKVKIDGKCYCLQHARMYVNKAKENGREISSNMVDIL